MLRALLGLSVEVLRSGRFLRRRRARAGSRPPGRLPPRRRRLRDRERDIRRSGQYLDSTPQQAQASMSNHDETRKTDVLRPAEAMRGATGAPTRARRRARPRRMLRGEQDRGTFDRTRPVCDESVTACAGSVQIQRRCRVTSWRGAGARREREYVVAVDSREYPPTLPCGGSRW
jgi:hypothetical protein